jgi:hypothetical protein
LGFSDEVDGPHTMNQMHGRFVKLCEQGDHLITVRDVKALQKAAHAPATRREALEAARAGDGSGKGWCPQAPGRARRSDRVGRKGIGQAESEGL